MWMPRLTQSMVVMMMRREEGMVGGGCGWRHLTLAATAEIQEISQVLETEPIKGWILQSYLR